MNPVKAQICNQAPLIGIPEPPAVFSDTRDLLVSYESDSESDFVIVRFEHCIEHRLTPINDEGLGKHPYSKSGLDFYSFHEIVNSPEAEPWKALKIKHFVLTFKDNTLDVLAQSFVTEARFPDLSSASSAITRFLSAREA
nr:hypothetical protein [uncultured Holophaga sp.]